MFSHLIRRTRSYTTDAVFVKAAERVKQASPDQRTLLRLYGLFKQAQAGDCTTVAPSAFNVVAKAKWHAWAAHSGMPADTARALYVAEVDAIVGEEATSKGEDADAEEIIGEKRGRIFWITLNRPEKRNAFTFEMYSKLPQLLRDAESSGAALTVLTGAGEYYSSGNDLSNFAKAGTPAAFAAQAAVVLETFVGAFVHHPLPLVALVNGPAIGISATTLGLCDLVLASSKASFHTPFVSLGQSPEGCSSVTFPRIMGPLMANDVLLRGRVLSALEAHTVGLVNDVIVDSAFAAVAKERVTAMASLPAMALRLSKAIVREPQIAGLDAANKRECALLVERWTSDECAAAVAAFFARKHL